jgi:NAD(P)H-hydrate epimerase
MRGYRVAEIRAAEKPLLDAGVPLMARAVTGLTGVVRTLTRGRRGTVLVLAGSGDNGGDALFTAADLAADGAGVIAVRVGSRVHEAAWAAAIAAGAHEASPDAAAYLAADAAVVLDGMRGIGGSGAGLRGTALEVALALQAAEGPLVIAVDVPSGIDADSGAADDAVLPADVTVTFGAMKAGLLREPARTLAGRVILIDIGLGLPRQEA